MKWQFVIHAGTQATSKGGQAEEGRKKAREAGYIKKLLYLKSLKPSQRYLTEEEKRVPQVCIWFPGKAVFANW
jgi:hypothetical protein